MSDLIMFSKLPNGFQKPVCCVSEQPFQREAINHKLTFNISKEALRPQVPVKLTPTLSFTARSEDGYVSVLLCRCVHKALRRPSLEARKSQSAMAFGFSEALHQMNIIFSVLLHLAVTTS